MAWLDTGRVPGDWAYVALRGALLAVLKHNAGNPNAPIRDILCPDFFAVPLLPSSPSSALSPYRHSLSLIASCAEKGPLDLT